MRPLKKVVASLVGLVALGLPIVAQAPPAVAAATDVAHPGLVSKQAPAWTPRVQDGKVNAYVQIGNRMFAGGTFTTINNANQPQITQPYLFAFDVNTGTIDTNFRPVLDKTVESLEASPDGNLVVGGRFKTVNGQTWKGIVELDPVTGARITTFTAKLNSGAAVYEVVLRNGRLFVGGAFSKIGGVSRSRLAVLDPATGAVDPNVNVPFAGQHNGGQIRINGLDVAPNGSTLVAIGNFTTAGGLPRDQIAMVDLTTVPATVSSWQTTRFVPACASRFDTYTTALDIDPTGSYFVVGATGAYMGGPTTGVLCDSVSRWELGRTGSGQQPTWIAYSGGDSRFSVLATGSVVYAGGHQRWENNPWRGDAAGAGAVVRTGIAALDPVNGIPLSWNPIREPRGRGVQVFYPTTAGLWFGDDTCCINGANRSRIKFMPLEGGSAVPQPQQAALPADLYTIGLTGFTKRSYNGTTFGSASSILTSGVDWSRTRGAFWANGNLYTGWSDGHFYARSFDGTTLGDARDIPLNGLLTGSPTFFPVSSITGMFLDAGRMYYTVSGDSNLYYRNFSAESEIVGAQRFLAPSNGGVNWSLVRGITVAGGKLFLVRTNGNLSSINFVNGAPVTGTETVLSGPFVDGINWTTSDLFVQMQNA